MTHVPNAGCSANDLILVVGGVACGKCGARPEPTEPDPPWCSESCGDGKPCPLQAEPLSDVCWYHRIARYPKPAAPIDCGCCCDDHTSDDCPARADGTCKGSPS